MASVGKEHRAGGFYFKFSYTEKSKPFNYFFCEEQCLRMETL